MLISNDLMIIMTKEEGDKGEDDEEKENKIHYNDDGKKKTPAEFCKTFKLKSKTY